MSDSPNNSSASAGTKRGPSEYFSGTAWITMLADKNLTDCTMGDMTFEPGCRNGWQKNTCLPTSLSATSSRLRNGS